MGEGMRGKRVAVVDLHSVSTRTTEVLAIPKHGVVLESEALPVTLALKGVDLLRALEPGPTPSVERVLVGSHEGPLSKSADGLGVQMFS